MRKLLLAVVVTIAATALWAIPAMAAPPSAPFTQCPAVGLDTSCGVLIVVNPGGSLTILSDPTQPPYDGVEDTLIGVLNNSGGPITSISLSGTSGAFGFDGDGLCTASPHPAGCPFATTGSGPDYAGPGTGFANIANGGNDGDVTFSPALASGASTYFSLEGPASAVTGGTIGHIEICKTLGSAGLVGVSPAANVTTPPTASFEYTVTDGAGTQTVVVRANAPGGGVACFGPDHRARFAGCGRHLHRVRCGDGADLGEHQRAQLHDELQRRDDERVADRQSGDRSRARRRVDRAGDAYRLHERAGDGVARGVQGSGSAFGVGLGQVSRSGFAVARTRLIRRARTTRRSRSA